MISKFSGGYFGPIKLEITDNSKSRALRINYVPLYMYRAVDYRDKCWMPHIKVVKAAKQLTSKMMIIIIFIVDNTGS